jgi:exopolysaccharide biosynthesis polyprenyl glycosylphosphotransferase
LSKKLNPLSTRNYLSASSHFTTLVLVVLDVVGLLTIFNINHFFITGFLDWEVVLTWKLLVVIAYFSLYYYLMDLYTFEPVVSQLGMLERAFIASLLTGLSIAMTVYLIGPSYIGGYVGRGVLITSLLCLWLYTLGIRYLLNGWFLTQRAQVEWVVFAQGDVASFIDDFQASYQLEQLLLLLPKQAMGTNAVVDLDAKTGVKVAGDWDDLSNILLANQVAGIIVVAPEKVSPAKIEQLIKARISGMRVYTISDFYEKFLTRVPVFHLSPQWLATTNGFELIHNPLGLRFKRYLDVAVAIIFGSVILPILGLFCVAILLSMGRPIFYRQVRVGENGVLFKVNKFRTMINNAEEDGAQYAKQFDPRVTPLGRILRQFRFDELPQVWNVLKGDMSFIGPRPERPEFVKDLEREIPYYDLRHIIKPGITGWAQVMYGYGENVKDSIEKLQYDLYYIKNYSLLLDISIIVRSIKVVLFGAGR